MHFVRVFTVTEKVELNTNWKLYHFGRLDFLLISVDKRLANKTLYKANYFSLKTEVQVTDWAHAHAPFYCKSRCIKRGRITTCY